MLRTVIRSPRLLPRIAIVFATLWLVRNLVTDIQRMPEASALGTPFSAAVSGGPTAPGDDFQRALKDLDARLGPRDEVEAQAGDTKIDPSLLLWASSYWLFPHRVHVLAPDQAPTSAVVVVATSGGAAAAPVGYSRVILARSWNGGALQAYRRP